MNVLLVHIKKNRLPDCVRTASGIDHLTVITEPGHRQSYGPEVDVRLVDSVLDVESVRREAMRVLRERRIDRILSPFEVGLSVCGYLRSYFGFPGVGYEAANAFTNKYVMKQRMAAAGIPVADHRIAFGLHDVPAAAAELGWPVIAKPVLGGGALNVCVFADADEFEAFRSSPAAEPILALEVPLVVEKFVKVEQEYHCDGIVHDGEVVFAATSRYFAPVLPRQAAAGSHILPPDAPERAEMLELHSRTVRALGLDAGVTHMEFLRTPDGLLAGEIACRAGGMGVVDAVQLQTGVDIWQGFLETSFGLPPTLERADRSDLIARLKLPVKPGRIVRLSEAETLAALPGVVRVDMQLKVGDVVQPQFGSAHSSGLLYFAVPDVTELDEAVRRILDHYECESEDVTS